MQFLNRLFSEALSSVSTCCPPLTSCFVRDEKPRHDNEKFSEAYSGHTAHVFQPYHPPHPSSAYPYHGARDQVGQYGQPWDMQARPTMRERAPRKSISSSIRDFAVRKHSKKASRGRPYISAPTNFRHLHHETVDMAASLQQPRPAPRPIRPRPSSFRPLELSIYDSQQQLSPMLPFFAQGSDDSLPPPPPAHIRQVSDDATLVHQNSYSSMSFHLPRRGTAEDLSAMSDSQSAPSPPPKSKARVRANTSPNIDRMVERIASAILERDRLQDQIENVIERQSIYSSSRPSTAHGMQDIQPMPSIPALPPAEGLTFAERISTPAPLAPERPRTAPPKSTTPVSVQGMASLAEMSLPSVSSLRTQASQTPPPPLPLVLRPPLRKKKSFSRVSNWLFPGQEPHRRDMSLDSVTNLPRAVKYGEGFYQVSSRPQRTSFETVSTVSTWETEEQPTAASTWSPNPSSPSSSRAAKPSISTSTVPQRAGTFGQRHSRNSVGVAF